MMADTECYVSCAVCSANFGRMVLIGPTETSAGLEAEATAHALEVHGAGLWEWVEGAPDRTPFARAWINNNVRATKTDGSTS